MTIFISPTFINGVLFGIYSAILIIIVICNNLEKPHNKVGPFKLILIAFTWPISLPLGFLAAIYLDRKKM